MMILQDLRHAVRGLLKQPGYAATAVLTLALGIGFSTATFSVVNAVLLRPLPYHEPDRLVRVLERNLPRFPQFSVSPGHYLFWRDQATVFEGIGAWAAGNVNFEASGQDPQRLRGDRVSVNLFGVLGVRPALGRTFEAADEVPGGPRVAILSHGAWLRRFGGAVSVVGERVKIDRQPVTIVGVMPPAFRFPVADTELWMPFVVTDQERRTYGSHFMHAVGRLRPGATLEQARSDMAAVSARLAAANPSSTGWEVLLFGMHDFAVKDVRQSLLVLFGAVALVLLIACANVANLLLARGTARQRELAIRASIGATRGRLVRQLLVEQLLMSVTSTAAGVLLAAWLLRVLMSMAPDALPVHATLGLDRFVLTFALGLAVITPLVFGLIPALQSSRTDLREVLAAGGRQGSAGPGQRTRSLLVTAEIALAMALLVGAGLLIRSFTTLASQPPGFEPQGAFVAGISLTPDKYASGEPRERFTGEFLDRVRAVPQVAAAALTVPMPMVDDYNSGYEVEGEPVPSEGRPLTLFYAVSEGFFDVMRIPVLRGRAIANDDRRDGRRVIVINEHIAQKHFAGQDPIGRRMRVGQGTNDWREIVGVVGNVKQDGLDEQPRAQVYESYRQHPYFFAFSVLVRSRTSEATAAVPQVREILRAMDAELPLAQVRSLEDVVDATVRPQRFSTTLIAAFGGAALLLAAIGLYGVIAYTVGLRRQEFAIRVAHGAGPRHLLTLVLGGAALMSLAGIALGVVAAWMLRGVFDNLLFGVTASDPATYALVATVLVMTTLVASAVPAFRATRVDPAEALRGN